MDTAFISLMTDVTGTLRLDLQDPRWQQLLRCRKVLHLTGNEAEFFEFYRRIINNNKLSGNLHLLFELTSGKVHQLMHRRLPFKSSVETNKPINGNVEEQCCIGLHLISIFLCHFNSFLKPIEVRMFTYNNGEIVYLETYHRNRLRRYWNCRVIGSYQVFCQIIVMLHGMSLNL